MLDEYQILEMHGLIRRGKVSQSRLARASIDEMLRFAESYLDHARGRPVSRVDRPLSVYIDSWAGSTAIHLLRHLALYVDHISIRDPLLPPLLQLTSPLAVPTEDATRRVMASLGKAIEGLAVLRPAAELGILTLTQAELLVGPPPGAIRTSDLLGADGKFVEIDALRDRVPQSVVEFARRFQIAAVDFGAGNPVVREDLPVAPKRCVAIRFPGDPVWKIVYRFNMIPGSIDAKIRTYTVVMDPGETLDQDSFQSWVDGEVLKMAAERLELLEFDLAAAHLTGSHFLTGLPTSREFLAPPLGSGRRDPVLEDLVALQLPYFEQASLRSICKARENEAAFARFRTDFRQLIERAVTKSESDLNAELRVRDTIKAAVGDVQETAARLQRTLMRDSINAVGSLVASAISSELGTSFSTVTALGMGLHGLRKATDAIKDHVDERAALRSLPYFFYWDATKRPRA